MSTTANSNPTCTLRCFPEWEVGAVQLPNLHPTALPICGKQEPFSYSTCTPRCFPFPYIGKQDPFNHQRQPDLYTTALPIHWETGAVQLSTATQSAPHGASHALGNRIRSIINSYPTWRAKRGKLQTEEIYLTVTHNTTSSHGHSYHRVYRTHVGCMWNTGIFPGVTVQTNQVRIDQTEHSRRVISIFHGMIIKRSGWYSWVRLTYWMCWKTGATGRSHTYTTSAYPGRSGSRGCPSCGVSDDLITDE